jgi:hypothetical protein
MIEARATITIVARDDAEADAVYAALHAVNRRWPETPVVGITETSREVMAEKP